MPEGTKSSVFEWFVGKKVWLAQYDDEDDFTLFGVLVGVSDGFASLRVDSEETPGILVNLQNVKEVELYREGDEKVVKKSGAKSKKKGKVVVHLFPPAPKAKPKKKDKPNGSGPTEPDAPPA